MSLKCPDSRGLLVPTQVGSVTEGFRKEIINQLLKDEQESTGGRAFKIKQIAHIQS